jgi:thymidine phosphorylase
VLFVPELIEKKKRGGRLTGEEIRRLIQGCTAGRIPDYQLAALLMAIYFQGLDEEETTQLTLAMAQSGEMVDLSGVEGITVDKHSSGGIADTTTLVLLPLVAAGGGKMAKMSGRGLGHTGGTIDKLEAIPGFRTQLGKEEFIAAVNEVGAGGRHHRPVGASGSRRQKALRPQGCHCYRRFPPPHRQFHHEQEDRRRGGENPTGCQVRAGGLYEGL